MNIPNDPFILLSYINTQLRDHYPSLQTLCRESALDLHQITEKLAAIDYTYDEASNQFK